MDLSAICLQKRVVPAVGYLHFQKTALCFREQGAYTKQVSLFKAEQDSEEDFMVLWSRTESPTSLSFLSDFMMGIASLTFTCFEVKHLLQKRYSSSISLQCREWAAHPTLKLVVEAAVEGVQKARIRWEFLTARCIALLLGVFPLKWSLAKTTAWLWLRASPCWRN